MANRKYTIGRPLQEVRLKNWPAGKVAQMKRAIEMLEGELNTAIASQIQQGTKRVVSSRVPKITGVEIATGFKSFSISFNEAKGISDLLFYEIQKDSTSSFANPTTYTIPQTTLTIPTTTERERIYVRVRAMNSKFEVGQWSSTVTAVGSSNFRINVERSTRTSVTLTTASVGTWTDIASASITVGTSAISCSIQAGVHAFLAETPAVRPPGAARDRTCTYYVYLRILKDGVPDPDFEETFFTVDTEVRNDAGESSDTEQRIEETQFGTFITPLESLTNQTRTYTVQAKLDAWSYSGGATPPNGPEIIIDNFDFMEIIQST